MSNLNYASVSSTAVGGIVPKAGEGQAQRVGQAVAIDTSKIDIWQHANRPEEELGDIDALAESIKHGGQSQLAVVRKAGERYELICGRRRYEACKQINSPLLAVVRKLSDKEAFTLMTIENDNRNIVSPFAEAKSFFKAYESGLYATIEELAKENSKDRATVSRQIDLARLITSDSDLSQAISDWSKVSLKSMFSLLKYLKADDGINADAKAFVIDQAERLMSGLLCGSALIKEMEDALKLGDAHKQQTLKPSAARDILIDGKPRFVIDGRNKTAFTVKIKKSFGFTQSEIEELLTKAYEDKQKAGGND